MPEDKNAIQHKESVDNILNLAFNKTELTEQEKEDIYQVVINTGAKVLPGLYQDYNYKDKGNYHIRGKIDLLTAISTELGLDKLSDTNAEDVAKKRAIAEFVIESVGLKEGYRDKYSGGTTTTGFNSLIIDPDAVAKFQNGVRSVIENEGGGADLVYFDRLFGEETRSIESIQGEDQKANAYEQILLSNVYGEQDQDKLTNEHGTAVNLKSSGGLGRYYNIDYRKESTYNLLHSSSEGVFSQETLKQLKDDPILGKYVKHRTKIMNDTGFDYYHLDLPSDMVDGLPTTYQESYSSYDSPQAGYVSLNPVKVSVDEKRKKQHRDLLEKNNNKDNSVVLNLKNHLLVEFVTDDTEGYEKPNTNDKEVIFAEKLKVFDKRISADVVKSGPKVGEYFKRYGPEGEEEGKWATTYYKDEDGNYTLFASQKELDDHMGDDKVDIKAYESNYFDKINTGLLDSLYKSAKESQKKESDLYERDLTGYLQEGVYVSDDYDIHGKTGDESGYTGKAQKVAIEGKEFNASDPTTYTWQYEVIGQRRNDGSLVPGTENEKYYIDYQGGDMDEDAFKAFKKPAPQTTGGGGDASKDEAANIEIGNVVTGLKAAAGLVGLGKAMKDIPIGEDEELSESFKAYMRKSKELSESGLTAKEKASVRNDLSNAYNLGAKNVLRASAGSRGTFLANMGMLNANRVNALIKMGGIDSEMHRKNMESYGKLLTFQEKYNAHQGGIGREMAYKEATRKSNLYGTLGSSLIGSAISDISHNQQMKQMKPYLQEMADQMGLAKTYADTASDAKDDIFSFLKTGTTSSDE